MPRGSDWENIYIVGRVLGVDPTPTAPRGALRFIARDGPPGGRNNTDGGGYRVVNFDDIAEVIGNIGAEQPRQTSKELRQEVITARREERREQRKSRQAAKAKRHEELEEPSQPESRKRRKRRAIEEAPEPEPPQYETVFERRQRKKREAELAKAESHTGRRRRRRRG